MKMCGNEGPIVRVFLPSQCLVEDSGLLLGWYDAASQSSCVTAILPAQHALQSDSLDSNILGVWENEFSESNFDNKELHILSKKHKSWLHMYKCDSELPKCSLSRDQMHHPIDKQNIIVIIYDSVALWRSQVDLQKNSDEIMPILMQAVEKNKKNLQGRHKVKSFIPLNSSILSKLFNQLSNYFTPFVLRLICFISHHISNLRIIKCQPFHKLLVIPAATCQVNRKWTDVQDTITQCCSANIKRPLNAQLRLHNTLVRLLVDVVLGIFVMKFLLLGDTTSILASGVMQWAQQVAQYVQSLLHWMMGAPAGLKLNEELAHFLGQFFLYHIYLWTGYLQFLTTVWSDLLYYITLSGWLGLSLQLALAQDLFSMMTLHIYCFYVYAARLYNLQVCALSSLWRLFRGKKWNVLRARVDSAEYDVDQLFVGTLLFTILLFLLPTTVLFYVVFATLRVLVLLLQGAVHRTISVINNSALYLIILRILYPCSIQGEIQFHTVKTPSCRPTYLAMELVPVSMSVLLDAAAPLGQKRCSVYGDTWGVLLKSLATGNLIYPWIENGKSSEEKLKQT